MESSHSAQLKQESKGQCVGAIRHSMLRSLPGMYYTSINMYCMNEHMMEVRLEKAGIRSGSYTTIWQV